MKISALVLKAAASVGAAFITTSLLPSPSHAQTSVTVPAYAPKVGERFKVTTVYEVNSVNRTLLPPKMIKAMYMQEDVMHIEAREKRGYRVKLTLGQMKAAPGGNAADAAPFIEQFGQSRKIYGLSTLTIITGAAGEPIQILEGETLKQNAFRYLRDQGIDPDGKIPGAILADFVEKLKRDPAAAVIPAVASSLMLLAANQFDAPTTIKIGERKETEVDTPVAGQTVRMRNWQRVESVDAKRNEVVFASSSIADQVQITRAMASGIESGLEAMREMGQEKSLRDPDAKSGASEASARTVISLVNGSVVAYEGNHRSRVGLLDNRQTTRISVERLDGNAAK
jgi:hypothetical protein